jgi:hypothetical protein
MTALACGFRHTRQAEPAIKLEVHNRSPFDVDVFALPSLGSQTRVRLGNVTGFTTASLHVPRHALRAGHSLVLYLHAIGSNSSWISPEVTVSQDVVPCLDIHSDPSGNLDRSVFYSRVASGDAGMQCGQSAAAAGVARSREPWNEST